MRDIFDDLNAISEKPDPVRQAQVASRRPLPKRFYEKAEAVEDNGAYAVALDGKTIRTPVRNALRLPTGALARRVAEEWNAQQEEINPLAMPLTRLANTAIDGVSGDPQAVIEDIMRYSGTDLICYRAESPERLVERQNESWDPVLEWVHVQLGARFVQAAGIIHVEQPPEAVRAIGIHINRFQDPFSLAALHSITTLTGSALLALAFEAGELDPAETWKAAHIDEDWNIELWGEDIEAARLREHRWREMQAAATVLDTLDE